MKPLKVIFTENDINVRYGYEALTYHRTVRPEFCLNFDKTFHAEMVRILSGHFAATTEGRALYNFFSKIYIRKFINKGKEIVKSNHLSKIEYDAVVAMVASAFGKIRISSAVREVLKKANLSTDLAKILAVQDQRFFAIYGASSWYTPGMMQKEIKRIVNGAGIEKDVHQHGHLRCPGIGTVLSFKTHTAFSLFRITTSMDKHHPAFLDLSAIQSDVHVEVGHGLEAATEIFEKKNLKHLA